MKNWLILSRFFILLAVILSNCMCASVAYQYCNLLWSAKFEGFSAPASVAFWFAIPWVITSIFSLCLSRFCYCKAKEHNSTQKDDDCISRQYAIEQIQIAIKELNDKSEKESMEHFIDFIKVLPPK